MEFKHYKKSSSTVAKVLAIILGVCVLVVPSKNDRLDRTEAQNLYNKISTSELEEDKSNLNK